MINRVRITVEYDIKADGRTDYELDDLMHDAWNAFDQTGKTDAAIWVREIDRYTEEER